MIRILLISFTCILFAPPSFAASNTGGGSSGGLGFTCPPDSTSCRCDGSYLDCKNMADKVCKDGKIDPYNCGQGFCICQAKSARPIERVVPDTTVPLQPLQLQPLQ